MLKYQKGKNIIDKSMTQLKWSVEYFPTSNFPNTVNIAVQINM